MSRLTIYLPDEIDQAFRAACDEKELAYSTAARELIIEEIRQGEMFDSIPDEIVEVAEKEALQEQIMAKQKMREKRASYDDRIQGFFRKRLQGDAAYDPDDMEELADGYRADAKVWFDDRDRIEEKMRKVDEWAKIYRAGYRIRQHAERSETETDRSGKWWQVGKDLRVLEKRKEELIEEITQRADSHGIGTKAMIEAIADEFSVEAKAVEVVFDEINPRDNRMQALVENENAQKMKREMRKRLSSDDNPAIDSTPE